MIYEIVSDNEVIDAYVNPLDAQQTAVDYRRAGLDVKIRESWLDGRPRTHRIVPGVRIVYWRDADAYYGFLLDDDDNAYDYGAFDIPLSQRYTFDHRTEAALLAIVAGSKVSDIGERVDNARLW